MRIVGAIAMFLILLLALFMAFHFLDSVPNFGNYSMFG